MSLFGSKPSGQITFRLSTCHIGTITATPDAIALCESLGLRPMDFVERHAMGEWGDIDPDQRARNQMAMTDTRIDSISAYVVGGSVIYVVSQQLRGVTTVMDSRSYVFLARGA